MSIIQKIRDRGALISAIIIAFALLGFILMDAFTGKSNFFAGGNSTTLGEINGKKVDYIEFEQKVKAQEEAMQAQGQQLGDVGRQRIIEGMWDQEVTKAIMNSEFDKLGFGVGKKEMNDHLFGANPPADLKQRFTNEQGVYDAVQAQMTMNQMKKDKVGNKQLNDYLEVVEFNRLMEKYSAMVTNSIYYPKWLIEKQNTEASGMSKVAFTKFLYRDIPDTSIKVSDKEIEEYINKRKDQFKQEENRSIAYVMFDAAPTAADSALVKEQLQGLKLEFLASQDPAIFINRYGSATEYYDGYVGKSKMQMPNADSIQNLPLNGIFGPYQDNSTYVLVKMIDKKQLADSVYARHILVRVPEGADSVAASRRLDSAIGLINSGQNIVTVMKAVSEDTMASSADEGIMKFSANQIQDKQRFDQDFAKFILFDGKKGQRKKIRTQYGYHYIEIVEQKNIEPHYKIAFFSKRIVPSDDTETRASNDANRFAGDSRDMKSFDANIEKDLKPRGILKAFASNIKPNDYYIPGFSGMSRSFIRSIYDAKKGEVIQPQLIGDKYVVAIVTEVLEEGTQPVGIARAMAEPVLRNKKKADQIKQKIGKITSLEAAATALNTTIETADSVRFLGMSPAIGFEPKVIGASFNPANTGKVVTEPLEGQSGVYVLRVDNLIATSVVAGDVEEQKRMMEAQARQRAAGAPDYTGQQQPPPHLMVLRKVSKIKDKRSKFY